mmetsp:Transcript_40339/g.111107  ORF Transcript_40339/g.111107 Transcript_40339/m.111107 type:complete len:279 (+) Transcript_40339:240-1076(+)
MPQGLDEGLRAFLRVLAGLWPPLLGQRVPAFPLATILRQPRQKLALQSSLVTRGAPAFSGHGVDHNPYAFVLRPEQQIGGLHRALQRSRDDQLGVANSSTSWPISRGKRLSAADIGERIVWSAEQRAVNVVPRLRVTDESDPTRRRQDVFRVAVTPWADAFLDARCAIDLYFDEECLADARCRVSAKPLVRGINVGFATAQLLFHDISANHAESVLPWVIGAAIPCSSYVVQAALHTEFETLSAFEARPSLRGANLVPRCGSCLDCGLRRLTFDGHRG